VSIGVASCPENAETIKGLIVEADNALYAAKRTGKNKVVLSTAASAPR
jgi:diguanylate cyclase (GGDEF)-like protein